MPLDLLLVAALLERGADVNISDFNNGTALHHSVHSNTLSCMNLILLYGANLNHRDHEGYTALDAAEQYGRPDLIDALRKAVIKVWGKLLFNRVSYKW